MTELPTHTSWGHIYTAMRNTVRDGRGPEQWETAYESMRWESTQECQGGNKQRLWEVRCRWSRTHRSGAAHGIPEPGKEHLLITPGPVNAARQPLSPTTVGGTKPALHCLN